MSITSIPRISPIIELVAPDASIADKEEMTVNLRRYLQAWHRWYCRLDADGLLDGDSLKSDSDGNLEVDNLPSV